MFLNKHRQIQDFETIKERKELKVCETVQNGEDGLFLYFCKAVFSNTFFRMVCLINPCNVRLVRKRNWSETLFQKLGAVEPACGSGGCTAAVIVPYAILSITLDDLEGP